MKDYWAWLWKGALNFTTATKALMSIIMRLFLANKYNTMRNILLGIILLGAFSSCKKDSGSPYTYSSESTIYSETEKTAFKEILLIAKPYIMVNNQKKYLVAESLSNVTIKVNNSLWGAFESMPVDTLLVDRAISGSYVVSDIPIKYPVIAAKQAEKDTLTTAGEYADLINNYLTLKAGFYICQVSSFEIKLKNKGIKKVYPMITVTMEVKENVKSSFIGEFEIEIKN